MPFLNIRTLPHQTIYCLPLRPVQLPHAFVLGLNSGLHRACPVTIGLSGTLQLCQKWYTYWHRYIIIHVVSHPRPCSYGQNMYTVRTCTGDERAKTAESTLHQSHVPRKQPPSFNELKNRILQVRVFTGFVWFLKTNIHTSPNSDKSVL
jgi:hypothetical protein